MSLITRIGPYFQALTEREITKRALAEQLGVSYTYLCKLAPKLPPSAKTATRKHNHALLKARKEYRQELAEQVKSGHISLAAAATQANCSERTLRRYMEKL